MRTVPLATLAWEGETPFNERFQDIYYHRQGGWGESDWVYVGANGVPDRCQQPLLQVGEIGFGTGLNFFNTVKHFRARGGRRLVYVAFEFNPIGRADLEKIHRDWPLPELRRRFYDLYPHNLAGFHWLNLSADVALLLVFGDVRDTLPQLDGRLDCWYVDGFNPARNPDCFSQETLSQLARCSRPSATLSSFSAASAFRTNLQAAGWRWEKRPGFLQKREMVWATLEREVNEEPQWFDRPAPLALGSRVAVIGGGIAGLTAAQALRADYQITVFSTGIPASAVPVAVPYLHLDSGETIMSRYHLQGWRLAMQQYAALGAPSFQPLPMLNHGLTAGQLRALAEVFPGGAEGASYRVAAGLVHTAPLLAHLANDLEVINERAQLGRAGDRWQINGRAFDGVIICSGWQSELLEPFYRNILRPVAGQGSVFACAEKMTAIECGHKSLLPYGDHIYSGGTFHPRASTIADPAADDAENRAALAQRFPGAEIELVEHFANVRGANRDYFPMVGPVAELADACQRFAGLRHDARALPREKLTLQPGLYYNVGLGSKGYSHSWLNAQLLRSLLSGAVLPLSREVLPYVYPSRFILRALKRRQL